MAILSVRGEDGVVREVLALRGEQGPQGEPGKDAEGAVLFTEQTLTEEQKAQARKNISAAPVDDIGVFANAVKTSASGKIISVTNASPLKHRATCTVDSDAIEDLTSIVVNVTGINLWDEEWEVGGINTSSGENLATVGNTIRSKNYIKVLPSTGYYVKCPAGLVSTGGLIRIYRYDENGQFIGYGSTGTENAEVITGSNWHYIRFVVRAEYGSVYNHDICFTLSDPLYNGTYEPYKVKSYKPNADGTVDDVSFMSPYTVISTNSANVNIRCEYNRDINEVLEQLRQAILSLGGNV